jgi:hypothetical protein
MGPTVTLTKTGGNGAQKIQERLKDLDRVDVLVGIPAKTTLRTKEPINNASLMFIHTHGSPIRGIPARPVIEPAIEADGNKQAISTELAAAAKAALDDNKTLAMQHLNRAGIAGENASKSWFTDARNNWAPNAPSTIASKKSDRPLIDTGALRRSLTHVIREVR